MPSLLSLTGSRALAASPDRLSCSRCFPWACCAALHCFRAAWIMRPMLAVGRATGRARRSLPRMLHVVSLQQRPGSASVGLGRSGTQGGCSGAGRSGKLAGIRVSSCFQKLSTAARCPASPMFCSHVDRGFRGCPSLTCVRSCVGVFRPYTAVRECVRTYEVEGLLSSQPVCFCCVLCVVCARIVAVTLTAAQLDSTVSPNAVCL